MPGFYGHVEHNIMSSLRGKSAVKGEFYYTVRLNRINIPRYVTMKIFMLFIHGEIVNG